MLSQRSKGRVRAASPSQGGVQQARLRSDGNKQRQWAGAAMSSDKVDALVISGATRIHPYPRRSWGPKEADNLLPD